VGYRTEENTKYGWAKYENVACHGCHAVEPHQPVLEKKAENVTGFFPRRSLPGRRAAEVQAPLEEDQAIEVNGRVAK
jgi:hypothetical protein